MRKHFSERSEPSHFFLPRPLSAHCARPSPHSASFTQYVFFFFFLPRPPSAHYARPILRPHTARSSREFLLQVSLFSYSVTHFTQCDPFYTWWPILHTVTQFTREPFCTVWLILHIVTHFAQCDPFGRVWRILHIVTHFTQCDTFCTLWHVLHTVTHFTHCDTFYTL